MTDGATTTLQMCPYLAGLDRQYAARAEWHADPCAIGGGVSRTEHYPGAVGPAGIAPAQADMVRNAGVSLIIAD